MNTNILDGKKVSGLLKTFLSERIKEVVGKGYPPPQLSVILVGDDPASRSYVRSKGKACEKIGMESKTYHLPESVDQKDVELLLDKLNSDDFVSGILVQLPLPSHFNTDDIINRIDPGKDVDGLHPVNMGKLVKNSDDAVFPCTPAGIIKLLDHYGIMIEGKKAVVLGRSDIVGKPISLLLMHRNGTVTVCHSRTKNLPEVTRKADIVVAAMGKPYFIDQNYIKKGAVVIDVGINRVSREDAWDELLDPGSRTYKDFEKKGYTLVGDVDFEKVSDMVEAITPVPGGVGPMTIAMLLHNTLQVYYRQKGIELHGE